ncbi:MAG: thioredoxin domain-containing protein [Burkholderiales bacterium]
MRTGAPPLSSLDHVRGDPRAACVLIEYGDYQCPYCAAAEPVLVEVLRRHNPGVMQAFRHFPLEAIHPMARPAAETAEFAGAHGDFWSMHGALMAHSGSLSLPVMFNLATLLGLPVMRLRDALSSGSCAAKVRRDFAMGLNSGVKGTPTFFIDGELYEGPVTADALVDALNRAAGRVDASPTIAIRT